MSTTSGDRVRELPLPRARPRPGPTVAVLGDEVSRLRVLQALGGELTVLPGPDRAAGSAGFEADVVVISCALAPLERADALDALRRAHPELPVVVVSLTQGPHAVRKALRAGAHGCVHEADMERALLPTVRAVLAGQRCVPGPCGEALDPPAFSTRERQTLALVAQGLPNGDIARAMFLAESTIKTHLVTAFRKLGVRSRAEAAALLRDPERARELGL